MAITEADINEMLAFLVTHPEYQERFRTVTAAPELAAIPSRMDRVEAALERLVVAGAATDARIDRLATRMDILTDRMTGLTERMDVLAVKVDSLTDTVGEVSGQIDALTGRVDRLSGDLGNLKGDVLEAKYSLNADNWLGEFVENPVKVAVHRLPGLQEARARNDISKEQMQSVRALDLIARGRDQATGEDVSVAVEVSHIVDVTDVARAKSRSEIIESLGLRVIPVVGGYGVTLAASNAAQEQECHHRPARRPVNEISCRRRGRRGG